MDKSIFRAYDVRGKYPKELNENVAENIAEAFANYSKKGEVVVGHDARLSSQKLYRTVIKTLEKENPKLEIIKVGLITTPLLYFLVSRIGAKFGIMITASHNPKNYNGLKVVGPSARPISGKEIFKITSRYLSKKNK